MKKRFNSNGDAAVCCGLKSSSLTKKEQIEEVKKELLGLKKRKKTLSKQMNVLRKMHDTYDYNSVSLYEIIGRTYALLDSLRGQIEKNIEKLKLLEEKGK